MKRLPRKFSILTANIPVSFFGMILGLVGLGNCWRVATKIWNLPSWIGEMMMLIAVVVWLVLILAYIGKWLWARSDALAEFSHPILCCFVGLVPVSTVLVALAITSGRLRQRSLFPCDRRRIICSWRNWSVGVWRISFWSALDGRTQPRNDHTRTVSANSCG